VTTAAHSPELERELESHRRELTGYCYRMLGSAFDAEDAVQETMVRAWRGIDRFEGRAALKSWLYRIATNVCIDMLNGKERRIRPLELGDPGGLDSPLTTRGEASWLEPIPDGQILPGDGDPAQLAEERETLRLAFVAALQHLPAQQRAVLILREVLRWRANEVAELLDTSVASVNSSLQRARASLDASKLTPSEALDPLDDEQQALLQRYVAAFEAYDIDALTSLLHEDAKQSMPPYEMWLLGREDILRWWTGPGAGCRGSRLIPTVANGLPAFGQYRPSGPGGKHEPWALQVLEISDGRIAGFTAFLDTERLFPLFGLPMVLTAEEPVAG
jgi:RNA polymerase sigma-70 factor, ECF subfamily